MTAAAFNFLKSIPMFSYLAHAYHIIFVPRGVSSEIQNKVVDQIMQRQREIEDDGSYDPILVAPEGFCSNGTCLMPFKKGAFNSLRQGHPTVIKYQSKKLKPSMAAMEMSIREVYLDLYLMLLDEYLCVPTGTTREQLASHTTQSLQSILLQIYQLGFRGLCGTGILPNKRSVHVAIITPATARIELVSGTFRPGTLTM